MTKATAKFTNQDGATLKVFASPGKKGIRVAATVKLFGQPSQTGCRASFENEAEAKKAFETLRTEAINKGWTEAVKKERASAFSVIPPAAGTKAAIPATGKPAKKSAA